MIILLLQLERSCNHKVLLIPNENKDSENSRYFINLKQISRSFLIIDDRVEYQVLGLYSLCYLWYRYQVVVFEFESILSSLKYIDYF